MSGAAIGSSLAIGLVVLVGTVIYILRTHPFRLLGVLVAGMALHNIILMVLIRLGTPDLLIRIVQGWKEVVIVAAVVLALRLLPTWSPRQWIRRLTSVDWVAFAFFALAIGYFVVDAITGRSNATISQQLIGVRLLILMPILYFLGRRLGPPAESDWRFVWIVVLGAGTVVGSFGLWELWFVPTRDWINWGAISFSQWLGYNYQGPGGLPPNFFQSTSSGLALRRMVSTYLSPLGIAYTGLLLVPLASILVARVRRGWLSWLAAAFFVVIVLSVLLSVTRLALLCLGAEVLLLVLILRRRVAIAMAGFAIAGILFIGFAYQSIGPLMTYDLKEVASPTRFLRVDPSQIPSSPTSFVQAEVGTSTPAPTPTPTASPPGEQIVGRSLSDDESIRAHVDALLYGLRYVVAHPLGAGPGSAVPRFGQSTGPGESALLRIGGELGILGALLYVAMFGGAIAIAARRLWSERDAWHWDAAVVVAVGGLALTPVMLTSDVWGNFSVMFLFWWLAGTAVSALNVAPVHVPRRSEQGGNP